MRVIGLLLILIFHPLISHAETDTYYCGCPTPWVKVSGPIASKAITLAQLQGMSEAEILEETAYSRLTCQFVDPLYPGFCRGFSFETGVAALIARGPRSLDKGGPIILQDVSRIIIEIEFQEGRRLAEVLTDSKNVQCSKTPAPGKLIQAYTRTVIQSDESALMRGRFDPRHCLLNEPLL
jgi:hypothetical protein